MIPASISFTDNQLRLNVAGLSVSAEQQAILDVQTAAVPEPETYALMLAGVMAVGFMARRRL